MNDFDKVLLVEGKDDRHVIYILAKHYGLEENFLVKDTGGVEKLLKTFPVQIKGSGIQTVGVLVDADIDIAARWSSIKSIAKTIGYVGIPEDLTREGLVHNQNGLPTFGAWVMPNNTVPGMLENFISFLVPINDILFTHAKRVVDELQEDQKRFSPDHRAKAHIHTWLAWQQDPGTPLGLAITKKYLDANVSEAYLLIKWLTKLFA